MENSKILLDRAVRSLEEGCVSDTFWSVGGGTVLFQYNSVKLSLDIKGIELFLFLIITNLVKNP